MSSVACLGDTTESNSLHLSVRIKTAPWQPGFPSRTTPGKPVWWVRQTLPPSLGRPHTPQGAYPTTASQLDCPHVPGSLASPILSCPCLPLAVDTHALVGLGGCPLQMVMTGHAFYNGSDGIHSRTNRALGSPPCNCHPQCGGNSLKLVNYCYT